MVYPLMMLLYAPLVTTQVVILVSILYREIAQEVD